MLWSGASRAIAGGLPCPALIGWDIPTKMFLHQVIFSQLKWLGRPNRSHVERKKKKIEKGEYETDNNDERVKRRIQRGDDDES